MLLFWSVPLRFFVDFFKICEVSACLKNLHSIMNILSDIYNAGQKILAVIVCQFKKKKKL
jgi:hypothetical protein